MKNLTPIDYEILESYKVALANLAEYLGGGYEIVLHSLENLEESAIKVINGHYSNRKEGAPITDLALEMLAEIEKSGSNETGKVYFTHNKTGRPIKSTTIPILGENKALIGLLCINFYLDINLNEFIESIMKQGTNDNKVNEIYSSSTDELIYEAVERAKVQVMSDTSISGANKNKEIVTLLKQKEIFQLKDAVVKVAALLSISKNTVYMHIRNTND